MERQGSTSVYMGEADMGNPSGQTTEFGMRRHPHPGFISLIKVPIGYRLSTRNVRLWRESGNSGDWFIEPCPADVHESDWTEWNFDFKAPQAIYHRGQLVFVSLGDHNCVERRDTPRAIAFANGNERSIVDLGHYIAGQREDGAIVDQTEIE
jgi:hypothetical protein